MRGGHALPGVLGRGAVIDVLRRKLDIVEHEHRGGVGQHALEADVVGLVGAQIAGVEDLAQTVLRGHIVERGRHDTARGGAFVLAAHHVAVVAHVLVADGVELGVFVLVESPADGRVGHLDALVNRQALCGKVVLVGTEVELCHTAVSGVGVDKAHLPRTLVGHGRQAEREVVLAGNIVLVAVHVVPSAVVAREVVVVGALGVERQIVDVAARQVDAVLALHDEEAVGDKLRIVGGDIHADALVEHLAGYVGVVDEDVVQGIIEAVEGVVVILAILGVDVDAGDADARLGVCVAVVGGVAVDALAVSGGAFGDLEHAAVCGAHGLPEVVAVDGQTRGILVGEAVLGAVHHEPVVRDAGRQQVIGDKLVDSVQCVGQRPVGGVGVHFLTLGLKLLHDGALVGHHAALYDGHVDAPFLVEYAVGLQQHGVAYVAVLGNDVVPVRIGCRSS